jgi:hypothetical protein
LCWFGTFFRFLYHVPRKIWQPWAAAKPVLFPPFPRLWSTWSSTASSTRSPSWTTKPCARVRSSAPQDPDPCSDPCSDPSSTEASSRSVHSFHSSGRSITGSPGVCIILHMYQAFRLGYYFTSFNVKFGNGFFM